VNIFMPNVFFARRCVCELCMWCSNSAICLSVCLSHLCSVQRVRCTCVQRIIVLFVALNYTTRVRLSRRQRLSHAEDSKLMTVASPWTLVFLITTVIPWSEGNPLARASNEAAMCKNGEKRRFSTRKSSCLGNGRI